MPKPGKQFNKNVHSIKGTHTADNTRSMYSIVRHEQYSITVIMCMLIHVDVAWFPD